MSEATEPSRNVSSWIAPNVTNRVIVMQEQMAPGTVAKAGLPLKDRVIGFAKISNPCKKL